MTVIEPGQTPEPTDLRARVAEALCPPHHRIGAVSSSGPLTPLRPCQLHQAQAETVAALLQPELDAEVDRVAQRGAAAIAAMGADVRAARGERDRFRLAWQSARRRATVRQLAGERLPGGALRQALIDAGIITATDRVADAVEQIRKVGTVLNGDDLTTLCPHCICADCGGRNAEHEPGRLCGCGCDPACDLFLFDSQLDVIGAALVPLVGSPTAEALAHAVWHALHPAQPTTEE